MRNRVVLLATVIGLLVGLAGVGLLVVSDDDGATSVAANLPKLPAAFGAERTAAAADMMPARPVEWRVRGELPDVADHSTAYRVLAPTLDDQRRLEAALGGPSVATFGRGEWMAPADNTGVDDCATSSAAPPGAPPDAPVACASAASGTVTAVGCAADRPCEPPAPPPRPPDLPTRDEARQIALRAFDKANIDTGGSVEVNGPTGGWNVVTEPRIGGLRAYQFLNSLQIGSKGRITGGNGQLGQPKAVGDYPLVTVATGVERLKAQAVPFPMLGGAEPAIAIAPGEPVPDTTPIVRTITGASLGLLPSFGSDATYLVPVFLFETDDGGIVPVPAVVDALLEQAGGGPHPAPEPPPMPRPVGPPRQVPPSPGTGGGGGGGSSSQACAGSSSAASAGDGNDNQPMTVEVCASPSRVKVGETVTFTLKANDPDAAIDTDGCQQPTAGFGDETDQPVHCMAICSRESFPPEATALGKTYTHAYREPGKYIATFTVDSCAPKSSHGEASVEIVVTA